MEEIEVIERYIILLLGVNNNPIPTTTHLQKEIFLFTKANPKAADYFNFVKHLFGPYSEDLKHIGENPIYHSDAYYQDDKNRYRLTSNGKKIFRKYLSKYDENLKFMEMIALLKMIRDLYDKLTTEELLFLVYTTYESYTEKSEVSKRLLSKPNRKRIAKGLLKKGTISEERYDELVT